MISDPRGPEDAGPPPGEPAGLFAPDRLEAVRECALLDAPPDPAFDRLTRLAARLLDTPMATVTIVDEHRQFFSSHVGLPPAWAGSRETPLTHSFCKFVAASARPLIVSDARGHPLLRDNPSIAEVGIVAYAGMPLVTPEGHALGSVAVLDTRPRAWREEDVRALADLAEAAVGEIRWRSETERRRRLEQELRRQYERLHRVVETAPAGIVLVRDDTVLFANATIRRMLGYGAAEEVEQTPLLQYVAEESREAVAQRARRRAAGLPSPEVSEGVALRRDGTTFPYRADAVPVELPDGPAMLAFVTDLTPQRALEEQLRQAHKMEAVGRLAGGIAHDFNNLLTGILAPAELALAQLPADSPARPELQEIVQAATRAAALTRQLLTFSRRQVPRPATLDLNEVVRGAELMLRRTIGEHIHLQLQLAPAPLPAFADRSQLEQVLLNLVVNAREAMPEGGELLIETAPSGSDVALSVTDTGAGMDPETLSRIFEPFFTTRGVGRGTGLGLSTVYGIVTQFGGHVSVHSAPGRGSTFRVALPRHLAPPGPSDAEAPASLGELARGGSGTVLLVEDEAAVRQPLSRMLERLGYAVVTATDGPAALALFESDPRRVDVVVSDVVMPRMGGRALLERLRALRPGLPAVLISGYDESVAGVTETPDELTAFLNKPFTAAELAELLRTLLRRG